MIRRPRDAVPRLSSCQSPELSLPNPGDQFPHGPPFLLQEPPRCPSGAGAGHLRPTGRSGQRRWAGPRARKWGPQVHVREKPRLFHAAFLGSLINAFSPSHTEAFCCEHLNPDFCPRWGTVHQAAGWEPGTHSTGRSGRGHGRGTVGPATAGSAPWHQAAATLWHRSAQRSVGVRTCLVPTARGSLPSICNLH